MDRRPHRCRTVPIDVQFAASQKTGQPELVQPEVPHLRLQFISANGKGALDVRQRWKFHAGGQNSTRPGVQSGEEQMGCGQQRMCSPWCAAGGSQEFEPEPVGFRRPIPASGGNQTQRGDLAGPGMPFRVGSDGGDDHRQAIGPSAKHPWFAGGGKTFQRSAQFRVQAADTKPAGGAAAGPECGVVQGEFIGEQRADTKRLRASAAVAPLV